jgi:hypothetical protein
VNGRIVVQNWAGRFVCPLRQSQPKVHIYNGLLAQAKPKAEGSASSGRGYVLSNILLTYMPIHLPHVQSIIKRYFFIVLPLVAIPVLQA